MKMSNRSTRREYVLAYQSYIWNECVSHRLEKHGYDVVVGDLVRSGDDFVLVTKQNKANYSIFDVVLPLPSPEINMPKLDTAEFMTDLLAKDDLEMSDLKSCPKKYRNI